VTLSLRRLDWILLLAVLALVALSALLVWSATSHRVDLTDGDSTAYLRKQLVNIVIGLVLMLGVTVADHRWVRIVAPFVYLVSVSGLVLVLTMGSTINGSRSWLRVLGLSIQPSELAKLAVVIGMALVLAERSSARWQRRVGTVDVLLMLLIAGVPAVLILLQPDLGTMLVLSATVFGVLAVSGAPLRVDLLGAALERDPFVLVDDLRGLLAQRLVSVTGLGRHDHVEPFHSQVAEAVLATTSPEAIRAEHMRLANALEKMPFLSPERRALHWAWAGEAERAATEAAALVAAARHALAYARAADVCEVVLALTLAVPTRTSLSRAYAMALTGSGHAKRAAAAYREAAELATGADRLDLERRAAENYLRSGSNEEGMALASQVASALGYEARLSPGKTIAHLLVERARLRLRGTDPRVGPVDDALAAKSDACYSLSTGFAMVDAISGALYQTRSTRFALDCGDPGRAARALATEACFVSAWGSRTKKRAMPIIEAADDLAKAVGDPMMRALSHVGRGICELQWGDFNAAIEHCDAGIALFREHGTGVVWEERTGEVFAIWALAWRGDWGEVARRCDSLARAGAATGDRYATMHAAIAVAACGPLASDQPQLAKQRIGAVMAGWPRDTYDLPAVRELVGLTTIATYEADGAEALRLLRAQWKDIERSRMLGLEPVLVTLADLRTRAALLAGELDEARTWSKKLATVPWATGLAALFRASIAAARAVDDRVLADLATAERDCARAGLDLHAAAALDRRGRLLGGDEGAVLVARAAEVAKKKEIRRPERAFAAVAPWIRAQS
jgi:hypothetical protein